MCGISGFIDFRNLIGEEGLLKMRDALQHRGPDDSGAQVFQDRACQVGFAQTRLAIIDLSPLGHQPMTFEHLSIVFNGEIYNYKEIRALLEEEGHRFSSNSDTEVILHAFAAWGKACVSRFIGMFAFCIFDGKERRITFARDRAGVKPLYLYKGNDFWLFGSELKAFYAISDFKKVISAASLAQYFEFGYVPAPQTIFENCYKLEPGKTLEIDLESRESVESTYWSLANAYQENKYNGTYQEAKEELKGLLQSAFQYRMVADVPVGVFLSGGYDSATVAALLQQQSKQKLKTFTIGFPDGVDESPFAKDIAKFLGTDHHEMMCTTKEAQSIIGLLPEVYDEPFADSSAIPTILVSQFAKNQVTVALSADGGDELFCGYNVYGELQKRNEQLKKVPRALRKPTAAVIKGVVGFDQFLPQKTTSHLWAAASALNADDWKQSAILFAQIQGLPGIYKGKILAHSSIAAKSPYSKTIEGIAHPIEHAMAKDFQVYLQDDILTKVDRATMSVGLEGREPLLDHRIAEFAAKLPFEFKFDKGVSKRILKDITHEYIPQKMMDRPKMGFSLPILKWLKGDLSYLCEEYLNEEALTQSGVLNVKFNLNQIALFKKDKLYYGVYIWRLLMFQMWYSKWMARK